MDEKEDGEEAEEIVRPTANIIFHVCRRSRRFILRSLKKTNSLRYYLFMRKGNTEFPSPLYPPPPVCGEPRNELGILALMLPRSRRFSMNRNNFNAIPSDFPHLRGAPRHLSAHFLRKPVCPRCIEGLSPSSAVARSSRARATRALEAIFKASESPVYVRGRETA